MKSEKLLTEVELEMMQLLWKFGQACVNEVLEALPAERKLAYTSVSTMLRILEQKGFVGSRKQPHGRGHLYFPKLEKQAFEMKSVQHLVDNVFEGAAGLLVSRLIETKSLSDADIANLRSLLEKGN